MHHEFTVGQVVGNSFKIFFKNIWFMLIVGLFSALPFTVITSLTENPMLYLLGFILLFFSSFLVQGLVVYAVFQGLSGQAASFSESLAVVFKRLLPIIGVTLLTGVMSMLGYLILIIPGIIVTLMLWVAIPVVVVENCGVGDALRRSRFLTDGYKGTIFFISLLVGIIAGALGGVQGGFSAIFASSGMLESNPLMAPIFTIGINAILSAFSTAFGSVVVTVGYYALRHEVEGVAVEDLASVFE